MSENCSVRAPEFGKALASHWILDHRQAKAPAHVDSRCGAEGSRVYQQRGVGEGMAEPLLRQRPRRTHLQHADSSNIIGGQNVMRARARMVSNSNGARQTWFEH